MPTRRSSRGSGAAFLPMGNKSKSTIDHSENDFTENEDSNRMSGAFDLGSEKAAQKNKLSGSLFSAKIFDQPRRRTGNQPSEALLPMRKTKAAPVKLTKKKAAPPVSESEFDNMADMFGTSPIVRHDTVPVRNVEKTPSKNGGGQRMKLLKTPVKPVKKKEPVVESADTDFEEIITTKPILHKKTAEPAKAVDLDMKKRFEELQSRFEKLSLLRQTDAEKLLDEYRKGAETRDHAAEKLVDSLKSENALLKERLENLTRSRRDSNVSVMSVASNGGSLTQNGIINLYQNLCGLQVTPVDEEKWLCTIEGRYGSYSFELEYDQDETEYTYTPVFTKESTVWERLPSYLKEEIVFGEGYLQSFFWRALNFLMSQ